MIFNTTTTEEKHLFQKIYFHEDCDLIGIIAI